MNKDLDSWTEFYKWLDTLEYIKDEHTGKVTNCFRNQAKRGVVKLCFANLISSPKNICWTDIFQGLLMVIALIFSPIVLPVLCYIESKRAYRTARTVMVEQYLKDVVNNSK